MDGGWSTSTELQPHPSPHASQQRYKSNSPGGLPAHKGLIKDSNQRFCVELATALKTSCATAPAENCSRRTSADPILGRHAAFEANSLLVEDKSEKAQRATEPFFLGVIHCCLPGLKTQRSAWTRGKMRLQESCQTIELGTSCAPPAGGGQLQTGMSQTGALRAELRSESLDLLQLQRGAEMVRNRLPALTLLSLQAHPCQQHAGHKERQQEPLRPHVTSHTPAQTLD